MNPKKSELLVDVIEHIDIKKHNVVPLVEAMSKMAFSARDLARAADIYDAMLREEDCAIILCLAGSLISAGLKNVIVDLVRNNMVDAIVSTGANMIDQDFFEALGFRHWMADDKFKSGMFDGEAAQNVVVHKNVALVMLEPESFEEILIDDDGAGGNDRIHHVIAHQIDNDVF